MWYFSWILGLGLACVFAILNAMWFELREGQDHAPDIDREAFDALPAAHGDTDDPPRVAATS